MNDRKPGPNWQFWLGLLTCQGRPWLQLGTKEGTPGRRFVGNLNFAVSMGVLALWAGLGRSPVLEWGLAAAALVQAVHWQRSRKNTGVSTYVGDPALLPWCGSHKKAWLAWCLLGVAVGVALHGFDRAAGLYFVASGASLALVFGFTYLRQDQLDQDLRDARLESAARADRVND